MELNHSLMASILYSAGQHKAAETELLLERFFRALPESDAFTIIEMMGQLGAQTQAGLAVGYILGVTSSAVKNGHNPLTAAEECRIRMKSYLKLDDEHLVVLSINDLKRPYNEYS